MASINAAGGMTQPQSPEDVAKMQMKIAESRMRSAQKALANIDAQIKRYSGKSDPRSRKLLASAKASRSKFTKQLQTTTSRFATAQKNYFQASGQYGRLLSGGARDAYMALNALFSQYGLGSLAEKIFDYVKNGYGADTISILLQDTPEYKKRFAANEARTKAGLPVLSPAEYISVENSYRQIMRQSGLPEGFYDTNSDFTKFISSDMSPTELQGRVDLATQATALANPSFKAALQQMGLSQGELAAYFLDQERALPILQRSAATAAIGAEALQRGLAFDQSYAQDLATAGVSREQAAQGYAKIADEFSDLGTLGQIYGGGWSQRQAEEDAFVGGTAASKQRDKLIGREKGSFSGATGGARSGLAQTGGAR